VSLIGRGDLNEYALELVLEEDLDEADEYGLDPIPMAAPVTIHGAGVDDGYSGAVPIGFDFEFDGVVYDELAMVSTNSYARLDGSINSLDNSLLYGAAGSVDHILAPWWDNTETEDATGYVQYETQTLEDGSRVFLLEWRVLQNYAHTPTNKRVLVFQVVLYENTNVVEYRYAVPEVTGSPSATSSASVGVKRDTSGPAVNANVRDFYGTDHVRGGSGKTPFSISLSAAPGNHYPGDATNTTEGERFLFRFSPPLLPVPAGDLEDGPYTLPIGVAASEQTFDPLPTVNAPEYTTLDRLVAISLFSDARADDDDTLPVEGDSRRGWWGSDDGDNFGSKLWLLERATHTPENRAKARDHALEALQWLLDEGIAEALEVEVEQLADGSAGLVVTITRGDEVVLRYPALWGTVSDGT